MGEVTADSAVFGGNREMSVRDVPCAVRTALEPCVSLNGLLACRQGGQAVSHAPPVYSLMPALGCWGVKKPL